MIAPSVWKWRGWVVLPAAAPRQGWEEAFTEMARAGDDALLDEPAATDFDEEEWQG